jgi:hypothetical protein
MSDLVVQIDESDAMAARHLKATSKRTYKSTQKALLTFVKAHPDYRSNYDAENDKLILPLPDAALKTFMGSHLKKADGQYKAVSSVGIMRSAIAALYADNDVVFNDTALVKQQVGRVLRGHKRLVSELKENGTMKQKEGKGYLKMQGYKLLCRLGLESGETENLLYLVLQWNLMVRTTNIKSLNVNFFDWDGDACTIRNPCHKGDQEGVNAFAKHVYGNPADPLICAFFAMGIHVVCNAFQKDGDTRIFQAECVESSFGKWLRSTVSKMTPGELLELGMEPEDVGTHSIRKGAGTYCSSQPGGPNPQTVRLRMDHSIGNTESRYTFQGEGTDQALGRFVAGLEFSSTDFAALPYHFPNLTVLTDQEWAIAVPGLENYPQGFKACVPYFIASLAANHEFAAKTLPAGHRLFNSPFWTTGLHMKLNPEVLQSNAKCATTAMVCTGLPPNHLMSLEVRELRDEFGKERENHKKQIDDLMNTLPSVIVNGVLANCEVNGAVAVTSSSMQQMFASLREQMSEQLSEEMTRHLGETPPSPSSTAEPFKTFYWNGRYHPCTENFRLPRDSVKALFNLWYCGNQLEHIAPYRRFKAYDMSFPADQVALPKLAVVMRKLAAIAVECQFVEQWPDVAAMDVVARDELFGKCFEELYKDTSCRRIGQLSYLTVYKHINKM